VFGVILGFVVLSESTCHALVFSWVIFIPITKTNTFLQAMKQLLLGRESLSYIQVRTYQSNSE
jgi:hypothetical protein